MEPQLPVPAGGVVPQMLIVVEQPGGVLCLPVGPVDQAGVAEDHEFRRVARAEERMVDQHGARPV